MSAKPVVPYSAHAAAFSLLTQPHLAKGAYTEPPDETVAEIGTLAQNNETRIEINCLCH
jgi:hypothetical protein